MGKPNYPSNAKREINILKLAFEHYGGEDMSMDEKQSLKDFVRSEGHSITDLANSTEETVSKQIILINSGALALVGNNVINGSSSLDVTMKVLLTITTVLLILSLVAGLAQLFISHKMYADIHQKFLDLDDAGKHMNEEEFEIYFDKVASSIKTQSSFIPFWIEIGAFALGAFSVATLIVLGIW